MTDNAVTDGDLRNARLWAEKVGPPYTSPNYIGTPSEIYNVARVVLATVEAPDPTLAESLLYRADLLDNGDPDGDTPESLRTLAARAEQIEKERDEAHAEVERLTAVAEDYARRATAALTERDEAREEIAWLRNGPGHTEVATDLPDPADVPAGEAWLVEVGGERRTAVKEDGKNFVPWHTVNTGGRLSYVRNEEIKLLNRLVPEQRVITNPDDLDQAKRCTIILDSVGVVCERASLGDGWFTTQHGTDQTPYIEFPVTVLWEQEEEA